MASKHLVPMTRNHVSGTEAERPAPLDLAFVYLTSCFQIRLTCTLISNSLARDAEPAAGGGGAEIPLGGPKGLWAFPASAGGPSFRAGAKARERGRGACQRGSVHVPFPCPSRLRPLLWLFARSDSSREPPTVPQGPPTCGTVLFPWVLCSGYFQRDFIL